MKKTLIVLAAGLISGFLLSNPALAASDTGKCNPGTLMGVRYGQRGPAVQNLQNCLVQGGFFAKNFATGYFGSLTKAAIKQFYQSTLGIDFTDSLGPKGIARLKQMLGSGNSAIVPAAGTSGVTAFSGNSDYQAYLQKAGVLKNSSYNMGVGTIRTLSAESLAVPAAMPMTAGAPSSANSTAVTADRVSETNVQVAGIDEPDILKTDGQNLYYAPQQNYYGIMMGGVATPPMPVATGVVSASGPTAVSGTAIAMPIRPGYYPNPAITRVIQALPASSLAEIGKIDQAGDLLLVKDKKILMVLNSQGVFGYDITTPATPQKKWELKYENNANLVSARVLNNELYLVTRNYVYEGGPCLLQPMSQAGTILGVPCGQIYHPIRVIPADTGFSVLSVDPASGNVDKRMGFLGSNDSSVIYMNDSALYVTYFYTEGAFTVLSRGVAEKAKGILPDDIISRLQTLTSYDISEQAKMTELSTIVEKYLQTLSADDQLKLQNNLGQVMQQYYSDHKREFEKTGIIKFDPSTLAIQANTTVPGYPVNQFALDEQNGYLRIATTVGDRGNYWGMGFGMSGQRDSANDVYVLDGNLNSVGSILGLGLTEKIYSARFVGDLAYLVTFRQTDPFYVLDLSNPQNPRLRGELKIPGYSAYLEPLPNNRILGVGQESGKVKVALFDVSSPDKPVELDRYMLQDYYTEVLSNHHAFLRDDKHGVVFIPGGQGGYIFKYTGDKLELVKAISGYSVKRAAYLNDNLYVLAADKITVLDENNWSTIKELTLSQPSQ